MIKVPKFEDLEPWLRHLGQDQLTWLALSLVVIIWMVWGIAKKIVRMGYFLMALGVGCAIAYGVATLTNQKLHPEAILAAGMSFAFLWSAIRAKVARVVTAITVAVLLSFGAHQGWDKIIPLSAPESAPVKKPAAPKGKAKPSQTSPAKKAPIKKPPVKKPQDKTS
jgi:hypothetical protein